jgi:hypothetical protein
MGFSSFCRQNRILHEENGLIPRRDRFVSREIAITLLSDPPKDGFAVANLRPLPSDFTITPPAQPARRGGRRISE